MSDRFELLPPTRCLTRIREVRYDMPDLQKDLRVVAYHEAGHAILGMSMSHKNMVAEVFEKPFEHATLGPLNGVVRSLDDKAPEPDNWIKEPELPAAELSIDRCLALGRAAHFLAGHQAEYLFHNFPPDDFVRLRRDRDSREAQKFIIESFGHCSGPLFFAQRLARTMLTRHWDEVEGLAEEIYRKGSIELDGWKEKRGNHIPSIWSLLTSNYGMSA